ncbi:MAG: dTMP kinase [archaeon]
MGLNFGKIIAVEGIDGAGKNTQVNNIINYIKLHGKQVINYTFPRYETLIGEQIARYLKGEFGDISKVPYELICIAYAADRSTIRDKVLGHLRNNRYIVMDRYTYSNLFTAAKLPENKWGEFINWIEDMEFNNLGVVKPDYNFYLYIDPELAVKRIKSRGKRDYQKGKEDIHENNVKLLKNVAKCYFNFAENKKNWFIINQMNHKQQLSEEEVFELIKDKLDIILK